MTCPVVYDLNSGMSLSRVEDAMVTIGLRTNPAMLLREPRGIVVPGSTHTSTTPPRTGPAGEAAIVMRAIEDPQAFSPLYEHYVDGIHGYCLRRVSDPDVAADLTSQIFIRALSALPKFQARSGATSFRSWLFTIAHNLVIDTHRTRHHHHSLDLPDRPIAVHDPAPSPEDHALTSDLRTALLAAMDTLTDQQRQIVDLRFAGLTGPEIASVLGLHLAAVKSLQFRAYSRLRTLLRDRFDAEFGQGIES